MDATSINRHLSLYDQIMYFLQLLRMWTSNPQHWLFHFGNPHPTVLTQKYPKSFQIALVTCSFFRHSYITPHHIFHLWFKLCIIQFFQTVKMGHCSIWPHTHLSYTTKLGSTCLLMMPHRMNKSYKKIFFFFISHLLLLKFYICTSEADIRQLWI